MPAKPGQLNEGIEKTSLMILETADSYRGYLAGEYEGNYEKRQSNWDEHYEQMRTAYRGHLFNITGKGVPLSDMNIAILGPGLRPVGRDLGMTEQKVILPEVNAVVIADFSAQVVHEARNHIAANVNMRGTPLFPMQIDVTDCYSTVYSNLISARLDHINDEDQLSEVAYELGQWTIEDLQAELKKGIDELLYHAVENADELRGAMAIPDCFKGCGINPMHSFELTTGPDREELPISSWYLPMVLAGTGAAAEHTIWESFDRVTSDPQRGARPNVPETMDARRAMYRDFYQLIANYNTIVATKAVEDILTGNPEAHVLATSDVNTCVYANRTGVLDRLHVGRLQRDLARRDIEMTRLVNEWEWHDEATHHHGVAAFQFRKVGKKKNGSSPQITIEALSGATGPGDAQAEGPADTIEST